MDMTAMLHLFIIVVCLFGLILIKMPIGFALYMVAFFSLMFLADGMEMILDGTLYNSVSSYVLVALPLFIFMGEILIKTKCSEPLFRGANYILRRVPGGMTHANIISCSIFAACSGSSTATTLAIGRISFPELRRAGYDRKITLGSIAGGGSLGILIPPSTMMIIYGSLTTTSVGKLFIGGFLPGIMMALLFCLWLGLASFLFPKWFPKEGPSELTVWQQAVLAFKNLWPVVSLVLIVMGSIYSGLATPTEAASFGVVFAMCLAHFVYGQLNCKVIFEALHSTVILTSIMMICIIGSGALGVALAMLEIPTALSNFVTELDVNRYVIWAGIVIIYMILGCVVDGINLLLLTTPVFFPIVVGTLGFDPVWFGVTLVVLLEISLLTPPVGFNLFVTHSIGGEGNISDTILGVLPFMLIMLVCIVLMTAFPQIILLLPSFM